MTLFRPTAAAPGRLMRLGVVLDSRNRPDRFREIARMCDGAGIDSLWVHEAQLAPGGSELEAWTAMTLAATETRHPTVGVRVDIGLRAPDTLAAMVATLDAASGGRVELTFTDLRAEVADGPPPRGSPGDRAGLERYAREVRELLVSGSVAMTAAAPEDPSPEQADGDVAVQRLSVEVVDDAGVAVAARIADDAAIPAALVEDVSAVVGRIHSECERNGRDPSTIGIALEAPVSIGRTTAEAHARAEAEPLFRTVGRPSEVGVFGTLEQCQARVIELAHEGVTDLRCILPNSADIHDVIAQLIAMAVGSTDVLTPNAPRSKAPDPPETWGGRASR